MLSIGKTQKELSFFPSGYEFYNLETPKDIDFLSKQFPKLGSEGRELGTLSISSVFSYTLTSYQ